MWNYIKSIGTSLTSIKGLLWGCATVPTVITFILGLSEEWGFTALFVLCLAVLAFTTVIMHIGVSIYEFYVRKNTKSQLNENILFECSHAKLPKKMAKSGNIDSLSLFFDPNNPEFKTLGVSSRHGEPEEDISWCGFEGGHRCVVTNYSSKTVFDVEITLNAEYREIIDNGKGGRQSGETLGEHKYRALIPVLKPNGENSYEFYIYNQSPHFVHVVPEAEAKIRKAGELRDFTASISYSSGGCIKVPMTFYPKKEDDKKDEAKIGRRTKAG